MDGDVERAARGELAKRAARARGVDNTRGANVEEVAAVLGARGGDGQPLVRGARRAPEHIDAVRGGEQLLVGRALQGCR